MIDRHYNLSCYALEHPYQAYYSQKRQIVELIDANNDIYQFRLPDHQNYDKVEANWTVKEFYRFENITFLLYQTNDFFIFKNQEAPCIVQNVGQVGIHISKNSTCLLFKYHEEESGQMNDLRAVIIKTSESGQLTLEQMKWELTRIVSEQEHMGIQNYSSSYMADLQIEYLFGQFCLFKRKDKGYLLGKLNFDVVNSLNARIKYQPLQLQFPNKIEILGSFKNTLVFSNLGPLQKSQNSELNLYFLKGQTAQIITLDKNFPKVKRISYLIYENFMVVINCSQLLFFQAIEGTFITKISIVCMLEELDEGASLILGVQHQKQIRYQMLFDKFCQNVNHFYLLDKEKLSIYHVNINELLNASFRNTMKINMQDLRKDSQQIHENVMKTLNFRIKKLKTLEQYITEGIKTYSFATAFRFLQNESNIFVLSDGMFLFFHAIQAQLPRIMRDRKIVLSIEGEMIKLSTRLINESKYEDHIVKGLTIANNLYNSFRNKDQVISKSDNAELYESLLQSKRVVKCLKQDKNKLLFQLSYQLAIGVKGYSYLEEIQSKKK